MPRRTPPFGTMARMPSRRRPSSRRLARPLTVLGLLALLVVGLALLAIPFLILAIALAAFLGPSLRNAMIAIGVTTTPIFVRLTRGQVLGVKVEDYVEAARAVGNPPLRIALRHILPNVTAPLMVQATLAIAAAVIAEASLSFLGLGVQPPTPAWGNMLGEGRVYMLNSWRIAAFPGAAIFVTTLVINLMGNALRDWLDPHMKL